MEWRAGRAAPPGGEELRLDHIMGGSESEIGLYFWVLLLAFAVAILSRRLNPPYALVLVITGLVVGAPRLLPQLRLDPQTLFTVFLPPLLFESAINLRAGPLLRDWKAISLYAIAGTILSTLLVVLLMAGAVRLPLSAALLFGALISTTDPISVIAVFKRLDVDRRLAMLVEAEALFNNDTAVVLFTVIMGTLVGQRVLLWSAAGQFVGMVVGGAAVGTVIGLLGSAIHHTLDDHLIEITLTSLMAFGSFLAAQALHVSGVIAVVAAGLVVGNLGMPSSMSPGTRLAISSFWEYAAFVVNSVVFLLARIMHVVPKRRTPCTSGHQSGSVVGGVHDRPECRAANGG